MADLTTPMSEKKAPLTTANTLPMLGASSTSSVHHTSSSSDGHANHHHDEKLPAHVAAAAAPLPTKPSLLERLMGATLARHYGTTYFQVFLVGLIAFGCPGQFNALSGMGGGGQVEKGPSDKANITLYSLFAFVSFFAGSIHNKLGSRLTLWLGSIGYTVYVASFLSYNFNKNEGFIIFAGALLGVCASLFWSAQGAIMMCYPTEAQKGRFIAIFWIVFNLGACVGSAVAMGLSWHAEKGSSLGNGTYGAFVAITFVAGCGTWLLKDPASVIRTDGSRVIVPKSTTWKLEFVGLYKLLRSHPWVFFLFPMFFTSNFFYGYENQAFNGHLFNLRTRALNSLLFWLAQMVGALLMSAMVDNVRWQRKTRAWVGWVATFSVVFVVWGGSYAMQTRYSRSFLPAEFADGGMDFTAGRAFVGPCFLYLFSGFMDAIWQCYTYWVMGSVSNDLSTLAVLAGLYKSLQSAGAAVSFALDLHLVDYMTILGINWGLCALGLIAATPVMYSKIKNHTAQEDDIMPSEMAKSG